MELKTTQNLNIYRYNHQTETAIFVATKHKKTIMACSYLNFLKHFFHFEFLASNTIKMKVFIKIPGTTVIKNKKIVWKHRSYLLIFLLELEIFEVDVK